MTFCLGATLDPKLKLCGVQVFLEEINNKKENTELNTFEILRLKLQSLLNFIVTK